MNKLVKALGTLLAITLAAIAVSAHAQVTEQWVARYDGPEHNQDIASKTAVDTAGNVYVTGYSYSRSSAYDYITVKYDTHGNELWVRHYNGTRNNNDFASALVVDAVGNVYVTGSSFDGNSFNDLVYATVKYDTNGNQLWARRYIGASDRNNATALAVDSGGNVYVTGSSNNKDLNSAVVKYDSNGNEVWVRQYSGGAVALAIDTVGNVYVTGSTIFLVNGVNTKAFATVKYDPNGTELWVRHYSGSGRWDDNWVTALAIGSDGNVYITGSSRSGTNASDFATVKYDANGTELWVRRYNGAGGSDDDRATALAVDSAGNVYVAGFTVGFNGISYSDYTTVKYDPRGNEVWVRSYNGPTSGFNQAAALAVDAIDNVYVTGTSYGENANNPYSQSEYATVKYDADGKELWTRRFSVPSGRMGAATALVVDAGGNVYVTGTTYLVVTNVIQNGTQDIVTIKYSPDSQPAPTAIATASSTLLECVDLNGETVTLSGAGSSDPGGLRLTYNWTGPFGTASGITVNVVVPLGTHVITLTVNNGSSSATATVTVTVQDTIAPYVNAGADVTLEAGSSAGAAYTVTPVSSDACSTTSVVITPVLSIYPLGATPVMVTATDASRNSASDSLVVTVVDTTPPTLTVPANITTSATGPLTPVTLGTATATDTVDGVITVTSNAPASGFAVGTTRVIYTATDRHANSVSKSQFVTVTDTTGPTLTIPADITTEATGALTPVALGTASASDTVDGALVVNNNAPAAGFPVGMTLVLYTATDSHANSVSMSQRVTVTDTTAPTLNAPGDITVTATGMFTLVNLGTASAMDLVDGAVAVTNDAPLAGFPVGMATVTYTTTDSHANSMTKTQRVTVTDSAAPLTVGNYTLISSTRVSRTDFIYTYRALIVNSGFTTRTPTATLNIATPGVTILDGTLSFGTVPAGTTATSTDTFSLRHDRSSAFSEADFHWQIQ